MRVTRDDWIDEGFSVLRELGADGLRIDALASRLGVTKGSFHHHFAGMPDYRHALLEQFRRDDDATLARVRSEAATRAPREAIAALPALFEDTLDLRVDTAIRSWASSDAEARATIDAVDARRLQSLEQLWSRALADPAAARTAALLPYLVAIGASVSPAAVSPAELREVYGLLARLVTAV